jgi:acyl carrier protein
MDSTREIIRRFVTTNFYVADPAKLGDDESLLDSGIIDSTGVLEVLAFLEQQFGVRVEDRDILPQNLDSIARLDALVARVRSSASQERAAEAPAAHA